MSKPVILGAGLAGLSAALAMAPAPVILVSPRQLGEGCSSAWAQGGIAAAVGDDDSADLHAADTVAVGVGINDNSIVQQVTADGRGVIDTLLLRGAPFDRDEAGHLRLGLEAAHSRRRIVHARDATGRAVTQAMIAAVRAAPSVEIIEDAVAVDLGGKSDGITGVTLRRGDEMIFLPADAVVLATGGAAALWRDTTNPHESRGGGLALAARAGAVLGDLEFVQFHPTAIDIGRDPMPLASEALRGEGAVLVDGAGDRFIDELQPRDIVARAIAAKIAKGEQVFLDARPVQNLAARFPNIYALCAGAGIDAHTTPIPVRPAAHYHMGGIVTDARGRSSVPGLWACGEVSCTGLHGANRLASNGLLEAASFGARVAADIQGGAWNSRMKSSRDPDLRRNGGSCGSEDGTQRDIRAAMSDHVGVVRDRAGLERAAQKLAPMAAACDMALSGLMIAVSALRREESRGAHYRSDFPQTAVTGSRSVLTFDDVKDYL
ncbi:MAG: L-aspartate oxidase [Alphaproteobacteria bacterium]|nr:L-aspartate oxidase [Alphaproteobacteria bacterium]